MWRGSGEVFGSKKVSVVYPSETILQGVYFFLRSASREGDSGYASKIITRATRFPIVMARIR